MTEKRPFFKKNHLLVMLLALVVGSFFSCHSSKKSVETTLATEEKSANFLSKKMAENAVKTNRISCRANLKFRSDQQNLDATANLFWVRDSCLWVQVKKFGIEGVRALVRRDSVFVINRLEQTFMAESIDFLREKYQLPAQFEVIDALVMAQPWLFPRTKIETTVENGLHKMAATDRENRFLETIFVKNDPFLLDQWAISSKSDSKSVQTKFDDWRKGPGGLGYFSFLRTVEFGDEKTGFSKVEAELSELEIFPTKAFRFEIPGHYKRVSMGR